MESSQKKDGELVFVDGGSLAYEISGHFGTRTVIAILVLESTAHAPRL